METTEEGLRARLDAIDAVFSLEVLTFLGTKPRKYLSQGAWDQVIPHAWQEDLENLSWQDLQSLVWLKDQDEQHGEELLPLHKGGFRNVGRCVKQLAISKKPSEFEYERLAPAAAVGMTPKKIHECERFSAWLKRIEIEQEDEDATVLDCGAGLGYLTLTLGQIYGVKAIGLEGGNAQVTETSIAKRIKMLESYETRYPKRVPLFRDVVLSDETSVETLRKEAQLASSTPIILAGLHCCGELSNTVIRLFLADENAKSLAVVGCCYGRFGALGHTMTFPMSAYCRNRSRVLQKFDRVAFRAACDSPFLWLAKSAQDMEDNVRIMFYRIVGEVLLQRLFGQEKYRCKKKIPAKFTTSFPVYFAQLLKRVETESALPREPCPLGEEELQREFAAVYTEEAKKRVLAMLALRTSFSSLIETVIVADRLLWILETLGPEQCESVGVVACFDPLVSPTNLCITAQKKKNKKKNENEK